MPSADFITSIHPKMSSASKVCVIGAGAAGLCAARRLAEAQLSPVIFEQTNVVGGTWVFNESTGMDQHGLPIHSSMYKSLKTNLPKEVMAFPDYPFPSKKESFLHHKDVLSYLENFARDHDLMKHVRFKTVVKNISLKVIYLIKGYLPVGLI